MTVSRLSRFALLPLLMAGCTAPSVPVGDYFDRWFGSGPALKPAELVAIKPTATARVLWQGDAGTAEKYAFTPAIAGNSVYVAGAAGQIVRFDAGSGKVLARIETKHRLSGGVGSDGRLILAGTARGEVLAFDEGGKQLWKSQLTGEVLSAPQTDLGIVVVRSGDGRIFGLDAATGTRKWVYQRTLPALTVRTHAGVVLYRDAVFAGFAGGRLVALTLSSGNVGWEAAVALPKGATELERVADISSLPVIDGRQSCAVAFQGRVACFDLTKGTPNWARDISSVAGMAIDDRNVYVSDDKGAVVAFEKSAGASQWKQDKLFGRRISGPAAAGRHVVVGDFQGYVHVLSRDDGSFAARIATDGSAIIAQPIALKDGVLVQTRNGGVYAITIQ
ncbi:MAG: outer membrane protein assembly factor BamB [Betaproteobacteria bacterium]|nr:outer membrane protein assembly factor BamB [Betaproteobacteria bacterium]MBI3054718.1 outer membrane protein assembly factor BamB [Betaproteobacteria bacterium]